MSQPTPPPYEPADGGGPFAQHSSGYTKQPPSPADQSAPYGQPYAQSSPPYGHGQQPYGEQPYGQGYDAYGGYTGNPAQSNNTMAMVSLIAGICGLTVLPFIGSIVAVITGHMARTEIARTGEAGSGLATAGLITGYIGVALILLVGVLFLVVFGSMAAMMGSSGYS